MSDELINAIFISCFAGLSFLFLNIIRLFLSRAFIGKNFSEKQKKIYIKERKTGNFTAFLIGFFLAFSQNMTKPLMKYTGGDDTLIWIIFWGMTIIGGYNYYRVGNYNTKLKKRIREDMDAEVYEKEFESNEESDFVDVHDDETTKLDKIEKMYENKVISSDERTKMRNKVLGID